MIFAPPFNYKQYFVFLQLSAKQLTDERTNCQLLREVRELSNKSLICFSQNRLEYEKRVRAQARAMAPQE